MQILKKPSISQCFTKNMMGVGKLVNVHWGGGGIGYISLSTPTPTPLTEFNFWITMLSRVQRGYQKSDPGRDSYNVGDACDFVCVCLCHVF